MTERRQHYDVVVVGGGITGAITARRLSEAGKHVCVLEAGPAVGRTWDSYQGYVQDFLATLAKVPNAGYPNPPQAPSPTVLDINPVPPGGPPDTSGYFVQRGPFPFGSDYLRALGGTTLHWFAHSIRMMPNDFAIHTHYGVGRDWPLGYDDMVDAYAMAEREMAVAADVDEQRRLVPYPDGYVYPMTKVPASYLDATMGRAIDGASAIIDGTPYPLEVIGIPESRNTIPNPAYDRGKGYTPVGAVGAPTRGLRCEGNSSCIPICPVQAKYSALKTMAVAEALGTVVITQAVACTVDLDHDGTTVTGITYRRWPGTGGAPYDENTVTADLYVLAAHSVENAKLLVMSHLLGESGQVGRNLMDHPFIQHWALAPEPVGSFRGPGSTSGIESLRDGEYRKHIAAVRCDIGNWGWELDGAPFTNVVGGVFADGLFGAALRRRIAHDVPRQFRLGFLLEQLPSEDNVVSFDSGYNDALGLPRPVIDYHIDDYTRRGALLTGRLAAQVFEAMGATDHTSFDPQSAHYLTHDGQGFELMGAGHLCGTHRMGKSPSDSVVDPYQQHWQARNLFVVGGGSMVTVGTSNPTLTLAALTERSVPAMLEALDQRGPNR